MIAEALTNLIRFLERIKTDSTKLYINECREEITWFRELTDEKKSLFFGDPIQELADKHKIILSADEVELFYITTTRLDWNRGETQPLEGMLSGGCAFNWVTDMMEDDYPFWQSYRGKLPENEKEFVTHLRWFESPSHPNGALYTPMFGCAVPEEGKLPSQFYFFDSGATHLMDIHSFAAYVNALVNSAAVYCWQYFYTDPEIIIAKNKGLAPDTLLMSGTSLHNPDAKWRVDSTTEIAKKLPAYYNGEVRYWDTDKTIDRLDIIAEYLERCVRILPGSFPFLDFTYHTHYYEKFITLYRASKNHTI